MTGEVKHVARLEISSKTVLLSVLKPRIPESVNLCEIHDTCWDRILSAFERADVKVVNYVVRVKSKPLFSLQKTEEVLRSIRVYSHPVIARTYPRLPVACLDGTTIERKPRNRLQFRQL